MKTDWLKDAQLPDLAVGSQANTLLRPFLWRLIHGEDLSQAEAAEFFRILLDKDRTNVEQIAGALVALAVKGETGAELAGFASVMLERTVKFAARKRTFADIGGTGSSQSKTFNVSTAAAFVIAGAGLAVAKHCNRRVTSPMGCIEVLEALGARINLRPDEGGVEKSRQLAHATFEGTGICFLAASAFHESINRIANIRSKLGIKTSLNLLGVLANPARPPFQVVGVWHPSQLAPVAEALSLLGVKRAWVVHGADGLDEITTAGETFVVEIANGKVNAFSVTPEDFGLKPSALDKIHAKNAADSAEIIRGVLSGKRRDAARTLVVLNAAAALLISGIGKSPVQAARLAEQSIDSDSARIKLDRIVTATNKQPATRSLT